MRVLRRGKHSVRSVGVRREGANEIGWEKEREELATWEKAKIADADCGTA
jgi:hypothetical protein